MKNFTPLELSELLGLPLSAIMSARGRCKLAGEMRDRDGVLMWTCTPEDLARWVGCVPPVKVPSKSSIKRIRPTPLPVVKEVPVNTPVRPEQRGGDTPPGDPWNFGLWCAREDRVFTGCYGSRADVYTMHSDKWPRILELWAGYKAWLRAGHGRKR